MHLVNNRAGGIVVNRMLSAGRRVSFFVFILRQIHEFAQTHDRSNNINQSSITPAASRPHAPALLLPARSKLQDLRYDDATPGTSESHRSENKLLCQKRMRRFLIFRCGKRPTT